MKKVSVYQPLLLILVLCFTVSGQTKLDPNISKSPIYTGKRGVQFVYDKVSNQSEAVSDWFAISGSETPGILLPISFAASFRFGGQEVKPPVEDFGILFNCSARSWTFLLYHKLVFLVDDESLDLGDGHYSTKPTDSAKKSGVIESMCFIANREQLEKIANGKQVKFQIGEFRSLINDEHKAMFRELLNLSAGK